MATPDQDAAPNQRANADAEAPAGPQKSRTLRTIALAGFGVLAVLGLFYWFLTRNQISTDDAFIDGRAIGVAAKASGYVAELLVNDNQFVHAGERLLEIDPRDYRVARERAAAALEIAEAQLAAARVNLTIAETQFPANLRSAEASRDAAAATLAKSHADLARQTSVDRRATTQQQIDAATAAERNAAAAFADAEAKLKVAQLAEQNIAIVAADVKRLEGQVDQARADLDQAELNLAYTQVLAPQDGWVTKRAVEQGNYVQVGQLLLSVVSQNVWVTANFKESQITRMRPGDRVDIRIDAYPDLDLEGRVDSIQMGTGARFSAFPPENATGNFVKIVQRVPVKIRIERGLPQDMRLPLGLSVVPAVHVR